MPAGIQVFNADGSLQFDISSRLFRTLTLQTTAGSAGSVTIAGASSRGTIAVAAMVTDASDEALQPSISVSGDTVAWGAGGASKLNIMVY